MSTEHLCNVWRFAIYNQALCTALDWLPFVIFVVFVLLAIRTIRNIK